MKLYDGLSDKERIDVDSILNAVDKLVPTFIKSMSEIVAAYDGMTPAQLMDMTRNILCTFSCIVVNISMVELDNKGALKTSKEEALRDFIKTMGITLIEASVNNKLPELTLKNELH